MRTIDDSEVNMISGAIESDTTYGVSVGTATAFVVGAALLFATAPIGAAVLAGASLVSSGVAIYTALN